MKKLLFVGFALVALAPLSGCQYVQQQWNNLPGDKTVTTTELPPAATVGVAELPPVAQSAPPPPRSY